MSQTRSFAVQPASAQGPGIPVELDPLLIGLEQEIRAGNFGPVRAVLAEVTASVGPHAVVEHLHAQIELLSGNAAGAIERARRSVQIDPAVASAWYTLGRASRAAGDPEQAVPAYRRALALDPSLVAVHISLGIAQRAIGDVRAAISTYRAALSLDPDSPEAHRNLSNALAQLGEEDQATMHFERGNEVLQRQVVALSEAGLAQLDRAEFSDAAATYRRVIELAPKFAIAWSNLGSALQKLERMDEAAVCYVKACELDPELPQPLNNLGNVQLHRGEYYDTLASYEKALGLQRIDGLMLRLALALPAIPSSLAQIDEVRERLSQKVEELIERPATVVSPDIEVDATTFYLSYHGLGNRALQQKVAQMHIGACPSLQWQAPHVARWRGASGRKIRVGLISKFLYSHSIGRTTAGLVAELDRSKFEVITIHLPPVRDDHLAQLIRAKSDQVVDLPEGLVAIRERVAALELDVLFYQDIGMESRTYFLAFARLAPVQCLSFGHPETTGIPNMDWFVSGDLYETPGSEAHYSERLHCLKNVGTLAYYYRPELRIGVDRGRFGLPPEGEGAVYLCPQTLFKFHPEFDLILGRILDEDPTGLLVIVEAKVPQWGEQLRARFARTFGREPMQRVRFVPQQLQQEFLSLIACADVMLDTIHFNGMNSSLEAFAMGTPVVTWPREFQRGRHTSGMYRRMGFEDLVADSADAYVRIAIRLGQDSAWRQQMRERIRERCGVLFEDSSVVRQFEGFFVDALTERASACSSSS